ncbi:hypothetical protein INN71_05860 [Nocardioides sp. ChNu-153]|uniref:hypothetical protein n=1 Tax=unclassified Nocardioides TaxID=2615069 RepID=UPI002404EBDD|nr:MULTISPECIES: hypothetical protein [unclassified Nocardioides]MDF9716570.1 hypothetical protein [Nocardioides sp. ChNu-99]MDN7120911.1 hypothetical protein [Nocardioides sp. ChNu-153]
MTTVRDVLRVVRLFAEVAVVAALLWSWWWRPSTGFAANGDFFWDPRSIEGSITGTASYLVVASAAGFLTGAVVAVRHLARPWVALGATGLAAAAAGVLTGWIGHLLGPEDPVEVAARSADGSRVAIDLQVEGIGAYAAMPAAALSAVALVLLLWPRRGD